MKKGEKWTEKFDVSEIDSFRNILKRTIPVLINSALDETEKYDAKIVLEFKRKGDNIEIPISLEFIPR